MDRELAERILRAGLAKASMEFVTSIATPIFWPYRDGAGLRISNGTAFFVDAGEGPFGVTAAHVVEGWRRRRGAGQTGQCQPAAALKIMPLDLDTALLNEDASPDI